ncbi:hypothetical protein PAPYR_6755 [Paratrimastix pyriformis]|uniref:Uncharacterized protein n=1 Tax=Paratrimastix pyriformis TaxID=342808 RepID=A0ABQ8UEL4_9EUKA|nr:hypothetical protein PAPYR_6755 [Paratrimastix pyriformis]
MEDWRHIFEIPSPECLVRKRPHSKGGFLDPTARKMEIRKRTLRPHLFGSRRLEKCTWQVASWWCREHEDDHWSASPSSLTGPLLSTTYITATHQHLPEAPT